MASPAFRVTRNVMKRGTVVVRVILLTLTRMESHFKEEKTCVLCLEQDWAPYVPKASTEALDRDMWESW